MPRVFISYRRDDTADAAGRLYQNLVDAFGEGNVFKDVDSIPGGAKFSEVIVEHISRADFALVLIGINWVDITNDAGERRLMRDDDLVRKEVECALNSSATVIPLLVAGASMPDVARLPADLKELLSLHAMKLRRDPDFEVDFGRLLGAMGIRNRRDLKHIIAWAATTLAIVLLGYFLIQTYFISQPGVLPMGKSNGLTEANTPAVDGIPIVPFDPKFLGGGHIVPLPRPVGPALDDAFEDGKPIDYLHYSLVMNEQRSLATFVAINFDREQHLVIKRKNSPWIVDKRLPLAMQRENTLYQNNPWDRGHLVPHRMVTWEDPLVSDPEFYQSAVSFFPATVPQHRNFNRFIWNYLERYVQEEIAPGAQRLIVFAGPVFRANDAVYRSTRIPRSFWQVIVTVDPDNKSLLQVQAFVADQYRIDPASGNPVLEPDGTPAATDRIRGSEFSIENYAISLRNLSAFTGLEFGYIEQYDVYDR